MNNTNTRNQILIVFSMFALLIIAYYFDIWQDLLKENYATTFESKYFYLRLWFIPVTALLFAVFWLFMFRLMLKHKNRVIAAFFLVTGICILFYPSIGMTFGITQELGISVNYFGNSLLFYSSALVAAMGLFGLLNSN